MLEVYAIFTSLFLTVLFNYLAKKKNFLLDKKYSPHKSFVSEDLVPITGGLIFFLSTIFYLNFDEYTIKILIFCIFFIGFLSDTNYLYSPKKRFLLQIFFILVFIYISQIFISSIRIEIIDTFLTNVYFKYFFTAFCLLILMNGANFMDGVNTLLIGYFLIVTLICLLTINKLNIDLDFFNLKIIFFVLVVLFLFNFFGKIFSGDSGAYLISFLTGFYLIKITNLNIQISPYFIACILWYPAYECFFSMIRKIKNGSSVVEADNKHLHQMIFQMLKAKFDLKRKYANTLSGLIINLFNFLVFLYSFNYISKTNIQLSIILFCLIVYNLVYFYLIRILKL